MLVVDDFGIKYVSKEHAKHLVAALHAKKYRTKEVRGGGVEICRYHA